MKKLFFLTLASFVGWGLLSGCQRGKVMDENDIMSRADSLVNAWKGAAIEEAQEECEAKTPAWVQHKADSLYKVVAAQMGM